VTLELQECTEFTVPLPNRPGSFAQLSAGLTARGVRIRVFMLYTSFVMNIPDQPQVVGFCKLIVDDHEKARAAFDSLGLKFREERALLLRSTMEGDLMPVILGKLADAGLNLVDAYGVLPSNSEKELLVVLSVSDEKKGHEIATRLDWSVEVERA
jgi:hypothetical protein